MGEERAGCGMDFKALQRYFEEELGSVDFAAVGFTEFLDGARVAIGGEDVSLNPRQIGMLRAMYNEVWEKSLLKGGTVELLTEEEG
jgi:hypothetical protein